MRVHRLNVWLVIVDALGGIDWAPLFILLVTLIRLLFQLTHSINPILKGSLAITRRQMNIIDVVRNVALENAWCVHAIGLVYLFEEVCIVSKPRFLIIIINGCSRVCRNYPEVAITVDDET